MIFLQLQNNLFHSINQFTRHFSKALNEALVPLGLYAAQWTIIYLLKTKGPATQKDLSQYLGVEAPTMTRTLARMEKSGWINRIAGVNDKREKQIELTPSAIDRFDTWYEAVKQCEDKVLQHISQQEKADMITIIRKMSDHL